MTSGQKKVLWALGLLGVAAGAGLVIHYVAKPKALTNGGGGGNGGSGGDGGTLPRGPTDNVASALPGPSPYGSASQSMPSFASYVAQNSTRIDPYSGNA